VEKKLYRFGDLKRLIRGREEDLLQLLAEKNELIEGMLRAPSLSSPRVQGGEMADPTYKAAQRMADTHYARMARLREWLAELHAEHDELQWMIDSARLNEREREYLDLRYVQGIKPAEIGMKTGYSESHIRNVKTSMLYKIKKHWRFMDGLRTV
jgi:DNA-directed RNA polymerase specialized sigma24 family protein